MLKGLFFLVPVVSLLDGSEIAANATDTPPGGDGYFYLVTAKNRLDEEGTRGTDSDEVERLNPNPRP